MITPVRYRVFYRATITHVALPLAIIAIVYMIGLRTGHPAAATRVLFLGGGAIAVFSCLGAAGTWSSKAITSPAERWRVQQAIIAAVGVANWAAVLFASVVIPGMSHAEFNRPYQPSPNEVSARTALERLGADVLLDTNGRIMSVELHDVSDDALSVLSGLRFVRSVSVDGSHVTDGAMAQLSDLHMLEYLSLARTDVTDRCLHSLSEFPCLQTLNLS